MRRPIMTLNKTAPIALASPNCQPRILAVSIIAKTLIAGPEYKNAIAGPRPAPLWYIPKNKGRTVQEHTAKIVPETDATPYERILFAFAPKYFITDALLTKTAIAPAMKKAGTRQRRTCSRAYHLVNASASKIALLKVVFSIGR